MKGTTPIIGITSSQRSQATEYQQCVERAGGIPKILHPGLGLGPEEALASVDALLLTGGRDIDPSYYGEEPDPAAGLSQDKERDAFEFPLLLFALKKDTPILAICRGFQVLNVAMGGKLIQDVPGHIQEKGQVAIFHEIFISPGSRLAAILGGAPLCRVNSYHHQALGQAEKAPDLRASVYSTKDGIIEGLESPKHRCLIGVQFHPEKEKEVPPYFQKLFSTLVQATRE
ncbi:MAG: gamma-glutamyl-gamma-aminobutyrate hydrolase family protein [Chloroflexi bacterium]|nr:gamma-glutamyl-gamma-aminobutyrate hydrolase family protein [Chloroflexota bacterium]